MSDLVEYLNRLSQENIDAFTKVAYRSLALELGTGKWFLILKGMRKQELTERANQAAFVRE